MFAQKTLIDFVIKRCMYQRTSNAVKEKLQTVQYDMLWKTIVNGNIKSHQHWKNVRNEILSNSGPRGSITPVNVDAVTVGICTSRKAYDLALSYLDFLESEQIKPNLATLGKYFKLLYLKGLDEGLIKKNEELILTLYKNVRKTHPVLDAVTLENVIQAISLTSEWKHCLDLLEEIKITSPPSAIAYGVIISAAFLNHEDDLAWKLLNEMLEQDKAIPGIVYSSYFTKVGKISEKSEIFKELEKLFSFLQRDCLKFNNETVGDLVELLKRHNVTVKLSPVASRGICKCCKSKLKPLDLSENEFNELKLKIMQNVIVGKDVFSRTTPNELKRFQNFISNMESFDVVVDGLNVAYSAGVQQSPIVTSSLVASVVSHFVNEGKKVLVLGRSHMNKWPKQNWGYVLQNATVFLTQDLSQDDPYLLYCALNSGKDTILITKDLMRGHKFLLKNVHLRVLFDRWLSLRQYQLVHIQESGTPIFKKPLPFSNIAQKNGQNWHVPCVSSVHGKCSTSNTWLCIQY